MKNMKFYLTLGTILFASIALFAQPANDDCSGIIDLGKAPYCSTPAQYTNINATASDIDPVFNIPACFNSGGVDRDVWFQFTVPNDGSIVDFTVTIFGDDGTNGTLQNPQVAVYRGDCSYGNLAELGCASAPNGTNTVSLDLIGLTPGLPYFIRVNDYSPTAAPNSGTFKLCAAAYVAEFIMGEATTSSSCAGTLYDSGGETGDYQSGENYTFSICPQEFHSCIILNVEYETEEDYDFLSFYQGADINGIQVTQVSGFGNNFEVQITGSCATVQFTSDVTAVDAGFKITWECSPSPCTVPPLVTCTDPVTIPALPFTQNNLSNCFSGNSIDADPCGSGFIAGNDYVFTYESPGDECIAVHATGTNSNAGLGVYNNCPTAPNAACISVAGGNFGIESPSIPAAFLENPGTYYIVFATDGSCSNFNFSVDTVTCPVLLPPASTCDQALNIGGCSNTLPEIIALNPGSGDPNFIVDGVNQGCFVDPQQNYSFFYFIAGADGKFGFTVEAADPAEASDIDINVWGPIANVEDICNFTSNTQPIRSTWSGGSDPTGLQDIHPVLNTPVLDEFDCGSSNTPSAVGDDFVRRIDVLQGEIYVILLDDFGQAIENGGISIDFGGTTNQVLSPQDMAITAGPDTVVCFGQSAQMLATGGAAYSWSPNATLSCSNCPNPVATPTQSTSYTVQIATTCGIIPKIVDVEIFDVDLGPDPTVCSGAEFQLNPNAFPDATYSWIGFGLSCSDCPSPTVSGLPPGLYTYLCYLSTPFCETSDTLVINVLPGQQPQYTIAQDQTICAGAPVQLGGVAQPGSSFSWTADPSGFTSSISNPVVTPSTTTRYYLVVSDPASCPVPSIDSVLITVNQVPQINASNDTIICQGQSVQLANTPLQTDVTYLWQPSFGTMNQPNIANPVESPQATTIYTVNATLGECTVTQEVSVGVIPVFLQLNVPDSVRICTGSSVTIQANVSPAGTPVTWTPVSGLQIAPSNLTAIASPLESILYTVQATVPGCTRTSLVFVAVDSLPADLDIYPADTTICQGAQVLLKTKVYEPADFEYMSFSWTPPTGQLTPDSLLNMVAQPQQTTIYKRTTQNGACLDTAFAIVQVIIPPMMQIIPSDTSVCIGQPVQLTVLVPPGVEDLNWTPAQGLSCDDCNNPVATVTSTTNFTVTGDFMGCPTSASAKVNIVDSPVVLFPADVNLCFGESITINLIADQAAVYSWTSTDPTFNQFNIAQPNVTPTQTTTYNVTISNGCLTEATITVSVSDATLAVSADTAVCRFEPVLLSASGTLPGSFLWSNGFTAQAFTIPVDATNTYSVIYTYGDGCTKTANITTTVNGESVPLDLPDPVQLCPGQSITLNEATVPAGATYAWSANPPDPTLGSTAGNPTVSPASTTNYTVTATLGQCVATRTVIIGIAEATLTLPADLTICIDESATLTATNSGGTLTWSTGANTPSIIVSPAATTIYSASLEYGNGCVITDDVTVSVTPSFNLGIIAAPNDPTIGLGASLELTASVTPTTNLNQYTFQWLENGITNIGTTPIINRIISTNDDSIRFIVIATSPQGCVKQASIGFLVVQPIVEIPNAFSPNGDDTNDIFKLVVIEGAVTVETLEIYNRWGQKVYAGKGNQAGWDGMVDGKAAPVDVYVYKISWRKGDGSLQEPRVGEVTLLR
jgi:gliding motility-associated-like protein